MLVLGACPAFEAAAQDVRRPASGPPTGAEVLFLSTTAYLHGGALVVPVHAWIFAPRRSLSRFQLFVRSLKLRLEPHEQLGAEEMNSEIFQRRGRLFTVDNEH